MESFSPVLPLVSRIGLPSNADFGIPSGELPSDSTAWWVDPPFGVLSFSRIAACGGSGGRANRPTVPSYRFLPPPSDQTEEQARFEAMQLVRAGAISDAELLRLREQPLSWGAVLERMNELRRG